MSQLDNTDQFFEEIYPSVKQSTKNQQSKLNDLFKSYSIKNQLNQLDLSKISENECKLFFKNLYLQFQLNLLQKQEIAQALFIIIIQKGLNEAITCLNKIISVQPKKEKDQKLESRIVKIINDFPDDKSLIQKLNQSVIQQSIQAIDKQKENIKKKSEQNNLSKKQPLLRRFESSNQILEIQKKLKELGKLKDKDITGFYNSATEQAIYQFQKANFKWADGIAGPETIELLLSQQKQSKGQANQSQQYQQDKVRGSQIVMDVQVTHFTTPVVGFLFSLQDNQVSFLQEQSDKSGVLMQDVAVGLRIFYDKSLQYKTISFSLEPAERCNPDGPFLEKVMYPDEFEKRKIICGTQFSEVLFECDFLMKLMSMGVQSDSKTPFNYPEALLKKGLMPAYKLKDNDHQKMNSNKNTNNQLQQWEKNNDKAKWSRYWLVCQEVNSVKRGNQIFIKDAKLGVDARQMTQDKDGKLQDKVIQDTNDECYKFAKLFTLLFEDIEKCYPCFTQLKRLYKSIALAKLIYLNKIPIDLQLINNIVEKQMVPNYKKQIPTIKYQEQNKMETQIKVPVDNRTMAIRALQNQKIEVNEKNIEHAIKQIVEQNKGQPFFDVKTTTHVMTRYIMGGVDMNFQVKETNEKDFDQNSANSYSTTDTSLNEIPDVVQSPQKQQRSQKNAMILDEESKQGFTNSSMINKNSQQKQKQTEKRVSTNKTEEFKDYQKEEKQIVNLKQQQQSQVKQVPFYFLKKLQCCVCGQELDLQDSQLDDSNDKGVYCSRHNPRSCYYCLKPIQHGCKVKGNKNLYDAPSFSEEKEIFFHQDCYNQFFNVSQYLSIIKQQDEWIAQVNDNILNQLKTFDQKLTNYNNLHISKPQQWVCGLCQTIHNNDLIYCVRCEKIDENQVNCFLKEEHKLKNQNTNASANQGNTTKTTKGTKMN